MNIPSNSQAAMSRNQTHGVSQLNQPSMMQMQFGQSFMSGVGGGKRQFGLQRKKHGNTGNSMIGGTNQVHSARQNVNNTTNNNTRDLDQRTVAVLSEQPKVDVRRDEDGYFSVADMNELCEMISSVTDMQVADNATFAEKQQFVQDNLVAAKEKIASNKEEASRVVGLQQTVTNQQDTIDTLHREKEALENARAEVATRLENVEGEINAKHDEIDRLTQEITTLNNSVNEAGRLLRETINTTDKAGLLMDDSSLLDMTKLLIASCENQRQTIQELQQRNTELQNQLDNDNLEKGQLVGRVGELEDQIAQLQQQNEVVENEHSEYGENEKLIENTELIENTLGNQYSGLGKKKYDGFDMPLLFQHQKSSPALTAKEKKEIPSAEQVTVCRHGSTDEIKAFFKGVFTLNEQDGLKNFNAGKCKDFEAKVVVKGISEQYALAKVNQEVEYIEDIKTKIVNILQYEDNAVADAFLKKMNTVFEKIAIFKDQDIGKYWILLRFMMDCAYLELNGKFTNLTKEKVAIRTTTGKEQNYTICQVFGILKEGGYIFNGPPASKKR